MFHRAVNIDISRKRQTVHDSHTAARTKQCTVFIAAKRTIFETATLNEKHFTAFRRELVKVAAHYCSPAVFKPPPPVGAGGGYVFGSSVRAAVRACVRASVRDSRGSFMFPRYLQYPLTDFRQTFVTGASWDTDELTRFWGQKAKVQGHTIAAEAHSTRRYRRVQLFLVLSSEARFRPILVHFNDDTTSTERRIS